MAGLEVEFWQFSSAMGDDGEVADTLEMLHERFETNRNLLLFGLWLGAGRGIAIDSRRLGMAENAVTAWHAGVGQPLHGACLALRTGLAYFPEAGTLRGEMRTLEAYSDRIEQSALAKLARDWPTDFPSIDRAMSNLELVLDRAGGRVGRERLALIRSALGSPVASALVP